VLGWLAAVGGLAAWYQIVSGYLVPPYSRLGRASSWSVYRWHAWIPLGLGVLVSLASVTRRRGVSARHVVAALGLAYGLAHYVVQGKGWEYHLYPLAAFAAVLVAAELPSALAARRRLVAGALAASLVAALVLLGAKGLEAAPATWWWDRERTVRALEADLRARLARGRLRAGRALPGARRAAARAIRAGADAPGLQALCETTRSVASSGPTTIRWCAPTAGRASWCCGSAFSRRSASTCRRR